MNIDNTPLRAMPQAELDFTASGTPRAAAFDDVYYSVDDGLAESRHTFLQGNALPERWQHHPQPTFCIAETGFGTGLNFLLTWQAWREHAPAAQRLHYISVERLPMSICDMAQSLKPWQELAALAKDLLKSYPPPLPGRHRLVLDHGRVLLDLHWARACDTLTDLAAVTPDTVDAWYLDGFAPARNADMWEQGIFDAAATLSREGATAATFTAAGKVRRGLQQAGFDATKVPGFGRKRESLRARRNGEAAPPTAPTETPWDLVDSVPERPQHVVIIGAGLAGAWAAHALASRGMPVTVLERDQVASGGSGNEQGILYSRLSHKHSTLVDFALYSYLFACQRYRDLFDGGQLHTPGDGELCGNLQLLSNDSDIAALREALTGLETLAQLVDPEQASERVGTAIESIGCWFPQSGWLHPPAVCRALLQHDAISLRENCGDVLLTRGDQGWLAVDQHGRELAAASCVILAGGTHTSGQLPWLPLRTIRGQTTQLPAIETAPQLRAAVCQDGYIAPARQGSHCIGASFNLDCDKTALRAADHRDNLAKVAAALPEWRATLSAMDNAGLEGRVGFRCASPDYLPVAGPVPDHAAFTEDYAALADNARRTIPQRGRYQPGLYVSSAHGSRGLTSTPLCGELLASMICGEPWPLDRRLGRAISPGRFIIRGLIRKKRQ